MTIVVQLTLFIFLFLYNPLFAELRNPQEIPPNQEAPSPSQGGPQNFPFEDEIGGGAPPPPSPPNGGGQFGGVPMNPESNNGGSPGGRESEDDFGFGPPPPTMEEGQIGGNTGQNGFNNFDRNEGFPEDNGPEGLARRGMRPNDVRNNPFGQKSPRSLPQGQGAQLGRQDNGKAKKNSKKNTTKDLDDYLDLDPDVKDLNVKNFDLQDKDIKDVILLMSRWTNKNFILDKNVNGRITILGPSPVTVREAYRAFLSALDANNLTTVQVGPYIKIIPAAEAKRSSLKTYTGKFAPETDQYITRIFKLKHINADEVNREFRDFVSRNGKLTPFAPTNSIIITDVGSNIQHIKEIIDELDVLGFETQLHSIRLKHSSAKDIAGTLQEIYGDQKNAAAGRSAFKPSILEQTRGGGIISKVIPYEQTNSLLVLANTSGFNQLKKLIKKLDVKVRNSGNIHVYYCEYAKAGDLASTLSSMAGGKGARKSTPSSSSSSSSASGSSSTTQTTASNPVTAELAGGVKVSSDDPTNALVITADSGDYQALLKVIKKLDIPRLQVFVETAIMEVSINDQNKFSSTVATSPGAGKPLGGFVGDTNVLTSMLSGIPNGNGLTTPLVIGGAIQQMTTPPASATGGTAVAPQSITMFPFMAFLNLLSSLGNTTILSTPQIIALDNEKAEFKVLQQTPVQSTFVSTIGGISGGGLGAAGQGTIQRLPTGITIKLTPHVNPASRTIRLELEQQVDAIDNTNVPTALSGIQVGTTSRVTNTTVVVRDKNYVMLGGLISNTLQETVTKVPLLGDIPILGWLFKARSVQKLKSNLVFLLRPRIIGTSLLSARLIEDRLNKRSKTIHESFGGVDLKEQEIPHLKEDLDYQKSKSNEEPDPFALYENRNKENEDEESASFDDDEDMDDAPKSHPKKNKKTSNTNNTQKTSSIEESEGVKESTTSEVKSTKTLEMNPSKNGGEPNNPSSSSLSSPETEGKKEEGGAQKGANEISNSNNQASPEPSPPPPLPPPPIEAPQPSLE